MRRLPYVPPQHNPSCIPLAQRRLRLDLAARNALPYGREEGRVGEVVLVVHHTGHREVGLHLVDHALVVDHALERLGVDACVEVRGEELFQRVGKVPRAPFLFTSMTVWKVLFVCQFSVR